MIVRNATVEMLDAIEYDVYRSLMFTCICYHQIKQVA